MRMCRVFRSLPLASKDIVSSHGLRSKEMRQAVVFKPPVTYCKWHLYERPPYGKFAFGMANEPEPDNEVEGAGVGDGDADAANDDA